MKTLAALLFTTSVAWAQVPPSCYRDIASQRCEDDLYRQQQLDKALDDQRFWIDQDARTRQDDAEYDAWFYRNHIQPLQDNYQRRKR